MSGESPIFTHTYDLLRWLLPIAAQMPREHRSGLAQRIPETVFDFQQLLITASKSIGEPAEVLRRADVRLAEVRLLLRLARDLHVLSFKHYEEGARRTGEIGRLLGGWLRRVETLSPASGP